MLLLRSLRARLLIIGVVPVVVALLVTAALTLRSVGTYSDKQQGERRAQQIRDEKRIATSLSRIYGPFINAAVLGESNKVIKRADMEKAVNARLYYVPIYSGELVEARAHVRQCKHLLHVGVDALDHRARRRRVQIEPVAAVTHPHGTGARRVVAVQATHQRALAAARGAGQHHAFAARHVEVDAGEDRQPNAALVVQHEGLGEAAHVQSRITGQPTGQVDRHGVSTEDTSSWVYG
jgi:hypothetical protein